MEAKRVEGETDKSQDTKRDEDNFDFVQVSRGYLRDWRALTRKSPLATEILMYLIEHMGKTSNAVICSYVTLAEVTGMSRASVARAIKVLKDERWIQAIKVGNATAYAVNARVFWQARRNQKKYAMFAATVIASESEQEKGFVENKQPLKHIPFVGQRQTTRMITNDKEDLPPPDQQDMDLD